MLSHFQKGKGIFLVLFSILYLSYFGDQKQILMILVVFQACFVEGPLGSVWGPGERTWFLCLGHRPLSRAVTHNRAGWELADGLIFMIPVITSYNCKLPKIDLSLRSNEPEGNQKTHVWVWLCLLAGWYWADLMPCVHLAG